MNIAGMQRIHRGHASQGFFGAAMLPMAELEYTGITEKLKALDTRFQLRRE
jgi:fructose 1,6-bisphosphate aldolase/phosphatase